MILSKCKCYHPKILEKIIHDYMNKNNFKNASIIGKGGFSIVLSIQYKERILASKLMILEIINDKDLNFIEKSEKIKTLMLKSISFKHENIIKNIAFFENKTVLSITEKLINKNPTEIKKVIKEYNVKSIIMEKAIFNFAVFINYFRNNLFKNNFLKIKLIWLNGVNEILIIDFIQQILNGLYYLKKCKFVHRDLKPENIVICKNFTLKLIDFIELGLYLNEEEKNENKNVKLIDSTETIMGPEYFKTEKSIDLNDAEKLDVFSLGVIIYYCLTGEYFYDDRYKKNNNKTVELNEECIEKGIKKIKNNESNSKLNNFVIKCLNKRIKERPTINDCIMDINKIKIDDKSIKYNNYNEDVKFLIESQKYNYIKKKRRMKKSISHIITKERQVNYFKEEFNEIMISAN
jgi:serine/threonine protein kinase